MWLNSLVIDVLRRVRPLLLTSTRSGRELFLLPNDLKLFVELVIGFPIICRLDHRHVPIICDVAPWNPSSRGASAPLIAATIAFASDDSCIAGAAGAIVLPAAATTAVVADLVLFRFTRVCQAVTSSYKGPLAATHPVQILDLPVSSSCLFLGPHNVEASTPVQTRLESTK